MKYKYQLIILGSEVAEKQIILDQIEHELGNLNLPKEFAFCNNSYSGGKIDINFKTNIHKIFISPMTDSLFDWIGVLEKATEIHTIDSSVFHLIKQLDLKCDKYFYNSRALDNTREAFNFDNQSWKVINLK